MTRIKTAAGVLLAALGMAAGGLCAAPVPIIFDTDMITDFDDVGALACLHAMADAGECEILATVSSTRGNASVGAVEVINAYYGRPNIPVGAPKGIGVIGDVGRRNGRKATVEEIAAMMKAGRTWGDGGHYKYRKLCADYPQWVRHLDSDDAPDANLVYRRALAAAADKSVVICTVGFLTNVRRLLETGPDAISPLNGRDLVAKKVKRWVAMACTYPKGHEYNSTTDPVSSRLAIAGWPTEVVFSDFQYGMDVFAGRAIAETTGRRSPVRDVFAGNLPSRDEIAKDSARWLRGQFGMGGRSAWDETAVLAAVRGPESYFNVARGTYRMLGDSGEDEWAPDEAEGRHLRLCEKVSKAEVGRVIDELICRGPKVADQVLFRAGEKGVRIYRIPAVVCAKDGTLVVVCDARHEGWGDLHVRQPIRPVCRRSTDGGKTWSPAVETWPWLWNPGVEEWGASDPSMVADPVSGRIYLTYNVTEHARWQPVHGTYKYLKYVQVSDDSGRTWSAPREITAAVGGEDGFLTSGRGCWLRDGVAAVVRTRPGPEGSDRIGCVVGTSDGGKTWRRLSVDFSPADESKLAELDDGAWYVNSRNSSTNRCRAVHVSRDKGKTWETRFDLGLRDPVCNAAVLAADGALWFLNCDAAKRANLTLKVSRDGGRTWRLVETVTPGSAAYSDLVKTADGHLLLVWEDDHGSILCRRVKPE